MNNSITFNVKSLRFDENYNPSESTRITTNFANLARGEKRQDNLRNALTMIDNRFNALAHWDNPKSDRYAVELDIISVEMNIAVEGKHTAFPVIEVLKTNIVDRKTDARIEGIVGNNFSSYVRDYDFSVLLSEHNKNGAGFSTPDNFGDLHGNIFKRFVESDCYKEAFTKAPVICLSVSSKNVYQRTGNQHPVLGIEYQQDSASLTDRYFAKMGLQVRFFMRRVALRHWRSILPAICCVTIATWSLSAPSALWRHSRKFTARRSITLTQLQEISISPA